VAYARPINPPLDYDDPDDIDAFTAWILEWQDWILPCLAVLAIATLV
jgi:hypothetical protein